ncbi:MAG TPA: aminoacyl-tRNA hydrolase [Syntrophales bacterium]|nr:aminoacyl-tRNA hydrolase [Syntrophales bacterium]HOX95316.1 aminoacyl-tRNA hydrolase [Syntrophales bacterium]HPI58106.1 aminoacyl-tRNA hydrolase [Syntrophales bacterium]HPN24641.1 aminoacyl-tRNA hydrolase [Syntrophales bacterium]HQM28946.1 aminoacyl-tRNA hydrolase [Syntrophales bacterium]
MKIIAGLGNPGDRYLFTRHNLGFMVADRLALTHNFSFRRKKFDALFAEGSLSGVPVILLKPQTFMNLSGKAVGPLVRFLKADPSDLVVVHDDLDLPFGTLRIKDGGGDGGHKGLQSVIEALGTDAFLRLRLGIGKPAAKELVEAYVLESFGKEEIDELPALLKRACSALMEILASGPRSAMNKFNVRVESEKSTEPAT